MNALFPFKLLDRTPAEGSLTVLVEPVSSRLTVAASVDLDALCFGNSNVAIASWQTANQNQYEYEWECCSHRMNHNLRNCSKQRGEWMDDLAKKKLQYYRRCTVYLRDREINSIV